MKFTVSGADRTSGQDVSQTFDAASAAEAESIASLSMLVSQVTPHPVQALEVEYATPTKELKPVGIDWACGIVLYARLLRIASLVLVAMAVVPALEYCWELGTAAWYLSSSVTLRRFIDLLDQIATSARLVLAIELLSAALLMRLASYVALAIREMSINRPKE